MKSTVAEHPTNEKLPPTFTGWRDLLYPYVGRCGHPGGESSKSSWRPRTRSVNEKNPSDLYWLEGVIFTCTSDAAATVEASPNSGSHEKNKYPPIPLGGPVGEMSYPYVGRCGHPGGESSLWVSLNKKINTSHTTRWSRGEYVFTRTSDVAATREATPQFQQSDPNSIYK